MDPTPRFVVVGGGTAGWLTALILQESFRVAGRPVEIAAVESSKLPTIGVGEGSTAVFRQMLRRLGLDEIEFLRETAATFKLGIRHKDWRRVGFSYNGPIDDPHLVADGAGYDGRFPVLDGLGLLNREVAQARMAEAPKLRAKARETVDGLTKEYRAAARQALPHRAFLESLHEHEDLTA